jgi:hypothetical protein
MKGQTAIEYLMTYGWAILIILIVAGVLAYYGIIRPFFLSNETYIENPRFLENPRFYNTTKCFELDNTTVKCQKSECFELSFNNIFCKFLEDDIYNVKE